MKSKLLPLAFCLTFLLGYVDSNGRIYGGYQIDITKAPWMIQCDIVLEQFPDGTAKVEGCGGTIVRTNLILTAGHCCAHPSGNTLKQYEASSYFVNAGTNNKDLTGGTIHYVKKVHVHPKYKAGGDNHFFHDVCLLELKDDITLSERSQLVQLALPTDMPAEGTDCTVTGYGTNPDHPGNKHLFQVHLKTITAEQCTKELAGGTVEQVKQHQICAQAKGKNQCQGDSGGPLHDVSTNRQIGVVSYGDTDCTHDKPSILARVTDNLDFINEIIGKTTPQSTGQISGYKPPQSTGQVTGFKPSQANPSSALAFFSMFKPSPWMSS